MKPLSSEVEKIMKRANADRKFLETVVQTPEHALRMYELSNQEIEYFKTFKSVDELKQEYREYKLVSGALLNEMTNAVQLFYSIVFIMLTIYFGFSFFRQNQLTQLGLLPLDSLEVIFQLYLGLAWISTLLVIVSAARRRIAGLQLIWRVVLSIGVVVLILIPIGYIFNVIVYTQRVNLIRGLLAILFTALPAALYALFIATRGKTLWQEFLDNLARLDPVGHKKAESIYYKKFSTLYGPPDESGFAAALLNGEASFPVLFATFLMGFGWALFFFARLSETPTPDPFVGFVRPFTFGFLGAYLFSLQMLFRRYVQSDLKSVAYTYVGNRILLTWVWAIVLSVIPGSIFGIDAKDENIFKSVLAFSVGVFPDIAWQVVAQFFQRTLSIVLPSFREKNPLHDIDGITIWIEARLLEEDIENIENLITAGIVDLMLRTNIKPERLVHWIDQGVLRIRLGRGGKNSLQQSLRDHGIVTATDLIFTYKAFIRKTKQGDPTGVFLSEQFDPLVKDLVASIDDDPNMYHVLAWREMNVNRIKQLPAAVKTQNDLDLSESTE